MSDYEAFRQESYKLAVKEKFIVVTRGGTADTKGTLPPGLATLLKNDAGVFVITLNRPTRSNSITVGMSRLLTEALRAAQNDDSVKVVVLNAVGKSFSGGADMGEQSGLEVPATRAAREERQTIFIEKQYKPFNDAILDLKKPMIAAVKGVCIGVMFLALGVCDLVYSTKDALFVNPMIDLALGPEAASSYTFPQILGRQRASEMFFRNQRLRAQDLSPLINATFDTEDALNENVAKIVRELLQLDYESLVNAKRLLTDSDREGLASNSRLEQQNLFDRLTSDNFASNMVRYLTNLAQTKPKL